MHDVSRSSFTGRLTTSTTVPPPLNETAAKKKIEINCRRRCLCVCASVRASNVPIYPAGILFLYNKIWPERERRKENPEEWFCFVFFLLSLIVLPCVKRLYSNALFVILQQKAIAREGRDSRSALGGLAASP